MSALLFRSTNQQSPAVNLRDAMLAGQAPDCGLYFPEKFPRLTADEIAAFAKLPYGEIAFRVLSRFTAGVIPDDALAAMCREAYNFAIPIEKTYDRVYVMRLDQGPTASFKDFAAQMMARMFGQFLRETGKQLTILTATSGDTGSAVAHAFHNVPGVRVIVLFPYDEVSVSQRKLMTTLAENVRTIAIDGKFDDCQAMVKRAFADPALKHIPLSSANSINIGRLLPQSIYYFYAASRVAQPGEPIVFSVPSGNFGDMMGAVVAGQMGLPIKKLIVPVNSNDAFPRFLSSGNYEKIVPSRNAVSNAMNVGHASNLARLVAVYGGHMDETGKIHKLPDLAAMRRDLFSSSVSDERTRETIQEVWTKYQLLLEPHGAVAWRGFLDWLATEPIGNSPAVILETANPAKFPEEIEKTIGFSPDVPDAMTERNKMAEDFDRMGADYGKFKDYLFAKHNLK
ncbi:MAG TPA: threonine synthase [Verrucomicrobiae bacterium]|jgi:threonine synthase|nr:threonine synthase [Verrucomicrobiae bacterium]